MTQSIESNERRIGLFAATGVGVGAIVGGGILALSGVAFATTGPAALVAFAVNGLIAFFTALSFAEMASKFPESGGTYAFSRKVLSVEAAFTVGWVVWFASIVAAMLYAVGFGYFALVLTEDLLRSFGHDAPEWSENDRLVALVAVGATLFLTVGLLRKSSGGGNWANVCKVIVFGVLILAGMWAVARQPVGETREAFRPFFAAGWLGLLQAMGYTFIALQGFDLIAAVGGEIRDPAKTIPRAMMLSLLIALLIYLPLLFVLTAVGAESGSKIAATAAENPEEIVATGAMNYLGPFGYWLVIVAAVLSMFTALQANLFAASRIALAMSRDRTLPSMLSQVTANRQIPVYSVVVTSVLVSSLVFLLPNVAAAGAAASLIFLVTFAIAHFLAILVRQRSGDYPPPFQTPSFPLVPVVGGLACISLAVFQGIAVPSAGAITVVWLSIGGLMFLSLFARQARLKDVSSMAANPELVRLRGNTPLVLVPIANPQNAEPMIILANTLVPSSIGRVLIQTIVVPPEDWDPDADPEPLNRSQEVLRASLGASTKLGMRVESLTTVSRHPMEEIARVARLHRCESVLLGLSEITDEQTGTPIERLLGKLNADVVVLRATSNWQLIDTERILVPVGGRGGHDHLLARLLGSLSRTQQRQVKFLRVVPAKTPEAERKRIQRDLERIAWENVGGPGEQEVIASDNVVETIVGAAEDCGLMILGVQRLGGGQKLFGAFTRRIVNRTKCRLIIISRRD